MHARPFLLILLALLTLVAAGCGDDGASTPADTSNMTSSLGDDVSGDASTSSDVAETPTAQPVDVPVYDGVCPVMATGDVTLTADGRERSLKLYLPDEPTGAPVLFMFHGNGDNAQNFAQGFDAPGISAAFNAIVVVPYASGRFTFEWPIVIRDDLDVDVSLFEGALSCLEQEHDIDNQRVYSTGFSAGALWTTLLVSSHADVLAAAVTFSGGIDYSLLNPFTTPARPIPLLSTHGGVDDQVVINFQKATEALVEKMTENGSTVVLCTHAGGHTVPQNFYSIGLEFLFAHRFGDESPYAAGLAGGWPSDCSLQ